MLLNLKKLREERAISQRALAEVIGVSQQSVNKYENHNIEPDIETLIRIADYFDVSMDYLVGRTEHRTENVSGKELYLDSREISVIKKFRKLNKKQKECVEVIIDSYI